MNCQNDPIKTGIVDRHDLGQIIRGVMIIFVVWIHLQTGEGYHHQSLSFHYWIVFRQILNCAVPVFFALSGYFTKIDYFQNADSIKNWWKKKGFKRYIVPFCVWSLIYTVINIFAQVDSFSVITVLKFFAKACIGEAAIPLYFVFVLIQLKLLTPFLFKILSKRCGFVYISIFVVVWDALYYLTKISGSFSWISFKIWAPSWIIYYCIGLSYRLNRRKINGLILLGCFLVAIIEDYLWLFFNMPDSFLVSQLKISNIVYGIAASLFVLNMFDKSIRLPVPINKFLCFIGDYSYGVYFLHYLIIIVFNTIWGVDQMSFILPLINLIQFIFVFITTISLLVFFKFILGSKHKWIIGL